MEEIRTSIIIEMMGRPESHLKATMKELMKRLDSEEGVKVLDKKIHKSKVLEQKDKEGNIVKVEKGKEMYTTFSEVNLELEHIMHLLRIVFAYMPAHIEITSPAEMRLQNFDVSTLLSEVTKKLHGYDAIAKNAIMQNNMLVTRMKEMHAQMQEMQAGKAKKPAKKGKKKSNKKKK